MTTPQIEHVIVLIESLAFPSPIYINELKEQINSLYGTKVEDQMIETSITAILEKYDAPYYGVTFHFVDNRLFFLAKSFTAIINS